MADDIKKILSGTAKPLVSEEDLLQYLEGGLPDAAAHGIEEQMADDPFVNDAVEGLQSQYSAQQLGLIINQLNRDLKKKTARKEMRRSKNTLRPQWWLYFSILLLLIILVLVYFFLHRQMA